MSPVYVAVFSRRLCRAVYVRRAIWSGISCGATRENFVRADCTPQTHTLHHTQLILSGFYRDKKSRCPRLLSVAVWRERERLKFMDAFFAVRALDRLQNNCWAWLRFSPSFSRNSLSMKKKSMGCHKMLVQKMRNASPNFNKKNTRNDSFKETSPLLQHSVDWLVDWLISRLRLSEWLDEWMMHWLIDWLMHWLIDCFIDWLIDCCISSLFFKLFVSFSVIILVFFLKFLDRGGGQSRPGERRRGWRGRSRQLRHGGTDGGERWRCFADVALESSW